MLGKVTPNGKIIDYYGRTAEEVEEILLSPADFCNQDFDIPIANIDDGFSSIIMIGVDDNDKYYLVYENDSDTYDYYADSYSCINLLELFETIMINEHL